MKTMMPIPQFYEFIKPRMENGWEMVCELSMTAVRGSNKRFDARLYQFGNAQTAGSKGRMAVAVFDRTKNTVEWKDLTMEMR